MSVPTFQRRHGFASYWEFAEFDVALTKQLSEGQAVAVPFAAANHPPQLYPAEAYYRPSGSEQLWALAAPDNAWRGYFLPVEEASAYQQALRRGDQRGRFGCLAAVVFLSGSIAWALTS